MSEFRDRPDNSDVVTNYDRRCFKLYVMLIDADDYGAEWDDVYERAFGKKIGKDRERARSQYEAHLERARWMTNVGYRDLL